MVTCYSHNCPMPYELHPDLTTPRSSTVLWRYMDFAKFVEMLQSQTLWLARVDQLPDPLEGTHTDAELAGLRKHLEEARAQQLIDLFRLARSGVYVNCWRSGPAESLAMWDLYGKGTGVVAVKSTVGRLKEAAKAVQNNVFISKVKYVNWNDAPGIDNVLVACSRKDVCYQHETEVRVMVLGEFGNPLVKQRLGIPLSVDIERLITEVVVGPREQEWVLGLTERLMKKFGLPQKVVSSNRLTPRQ